MHFLCILLVFSIYDLGVLAPLLSIAKNVLEPVSRWKGVMFCLFVFSWRVVHRASPVCTKSTAFSVYSFLLAPLISSSCKVREVLVYVGCRLISYDGVYHEITLLAVCPLICLSCIVKHSTVSNVHGPLPSPLEALVS